jgi:hypothetical protein
LQAFPHVSWQVAVLHVHETAWQEPLLQTRFTPHDPFSLHDVPQLSWQALLSQPVDTQAHVPLLQVPLVQSEPEQQS